MKRPVITIVGSYAVGMTMRTERFPTVGETLMGNSFQKLHGGKGSNQAVGCSRLGAEVNLIACIGDDLFGRDALFLYQQEGMNTNWIKQSKKLATGVGFIIVDNHGQNIITLDPGANNELTGEYIQQVKEVIFRSDVVLMQLEIPVETISVVAEIAAKAGVKTILNPAPYRHLPDQIWKYIHTITPNEKEAKLALGYSPEMNIDWGDLGIDLLKKGPENVVITLGEKGAHFTTCKLRNRSGLIPVRMVDVIDTTGAGDAFNAGLSVAIAEGKSLQEAIKFASATATLSVMKYGVIESMPYRYEVEEELKHIS